MGTYECPNCRTPIYANAIMKECDCPNCGAHISLSFSDSVREGEALGNGVVKILKYVAIFIAAPFICVYFGILFLIAKQKLKGIACLIAGLIASAFFIVSCLMGVSDDAFPEVILIIASIMYIAAVVIVFKIILSKK